MKQSTNPSLHPGPGWRSWAKLLPLPGLIGIAMIASAQTVVVQPPPPPPSLTTPPEASTTDTNRAPATGTEESAGAAAVPVTQQPFQWGPITLHPHVSYQFTYGDGLQSSPGNQHKSAINQFAPGIGMEIGRHWQLDYTPTFMIYSDPSFHNVVDQSIVLNGATIWQDWSLALRQSVSLTEDPQIATASQVSQQNYLTTFDARLLLNSQNSLDFNLAQNIEHSEETTGTNVLAANLQSSQDWSVMNWLDHHWGPNLGLGGGVGAGYANVNLGADMTYETFQGRILWKVAHKINLAINGGGEVRQFLDTTQPNLFSPIYGVAIFYQPTETTTININASRNVSVSYFENQITDISAFSATINQRLIKRYYLGLAAGYDYTRYKATATGVVAGRLDQYYYVTVSLGTGFLKRGTASVFYTYSSNNSNVPGFGYNSDQVGFNISYRY
jgi:hypothetical protein